MDTCPRRKRKLQSLQIALAVIAMNKRTKITSERKKRAEWEPLELIL